VDAPIADEVKRQFTANGAYFMSAPDIDAVGRALVSPQRLPNPALVGRPATYIAQQAGVTVPATTQVLIAELAGVGRDYPLSIEKLCPILSFYIVNDWREGCERCKQILRYGGMGHTMSIHSRNDDVILQFGLKKPAFRIVVNSPTTHGSIGLTTGLDPSMTLGCGGYGGNITSDNISPRHLLNIKRLAYEITPAVTRRPQPAAAGATPLPQAPVRPTPPRGIAAEPLARRIDEFLASRGYAAVGFPSAGGKPKSTPADATPARAGSSESPMKVEKAADFVCEDDVRQALRQGRKITVGDRTIVTPAARDLAEQHRIFVQAAWPRGGKL
jgi:acetaldehyde dehydrogenase (acetylating)